MNCALPYVQRLFHPNQNVGVCCNNHVGFPMNLKEFNESSELQQLKDDLENDIWPEHCWMCKEQEDRGIESMRQQTLESYPDLSKIQMYDVKFSNKCNLACRMCSPEYSSKMATEQKLDLKYRRMGPETLKYITDGMADLVNLVFAGGDPSIISEVEHMCQLCIDNGYAKNIDLAFVSNGLKRNEKLIELSQHFKTVHWTVSIDGIGAIQDYARYGSIWEEVDKNTRHLAEMKQSVSVNTVMTAYNIPYLHHICEYMIDLNKTSGRPVQHWGTTVVVPREMSPFVYHGKHKELLDQYIKNVYAKYKTPFINEYLADNTSSGGWDQFLTFTHDYDILRNQDSSMYFWHDIESWQAQNKEWLD